MSSIPAKRLRAVPNADGAVERAQQRDLFALVLRSEPSRRGKPFSERTIGAYLDAVISLDRYLTSIGHPGGFDSMTVHHFNGRTRPRIGPPSRDRRLRGAHRHRQESC
jgi:hypothetical protein